MNLLPWYFQHIEGPRRHQQSQRRIKTSGNSQNHMMHARMLQTLFQSHRLNRKNFLAPSVSLPVISRNKGTAVNSPQKPLLLIFLNSVCIQRKLHSPVTLPTRCRMSRCPAPLCSQTLQIQICINDLRSKSPGLCQQGSVFPNQIMSAKYQILSRLSLSGIGIHISADKTG